MSVRSRLGSRLVHRFVPEHLADSVLGDLDELFAGEAAPSRTRATFRYWRRLAAVLWHLGPRPGRRPASVPGESPMAVWLTDLRHGLRLFFTQPAYSWAAMVTLALAIGANTVIFAIVNVLVLRPLPLADPEHLGWVLTNGPNASQDRAGVSLPEYAVFRDEADAFSQLAARRSSTAIMRTGNRSERVSDQLVVGDLHGVWGVGASIGRVLNADDERADAPAVVTLSYHLWRTRFGADPNVLGRSIFLDGRSHEVVGVIAPDIELGSLAEIDLWTPFAGDPRVASRIERGWRPVGRLAAGRTTTEANAQIGAIGARLADEYPDTSRDWTSRVGTTREALAGGNTWVVLTLLAVVVGLLLVLACANIMNLLIARLLGRQRELAVRTALGATPSRVVRQVVSEGLVIGIAGGLLGLAIAAAGLRGVHTMSAEPFFQQLRFDVRVIGFAGALALLAPLLFSIVPTLRMLGRDVHAALGTGSARAIGGGLAGRGRTALVVVQVSLAVTLLVVATLVVKSVRAVIHADLGYAPDMLLSAEVDVPAWKYGDETRALAVRERLVDRARAIAGADAAAMANEIPGLTFPDTTPFDIAGREATPRDRPSAGLLVVSTDYFAVTRIPILAGRAFLPADAADPRAAVAVVSMETARRYWTSPSDAIGATVHVPPSGGSEAIQATVVGVARDTANADLDLHPTPMLILLDEHRPARSSYLLVRSATPRALAPALRQAISEVDPDIPASHVRTVAEAFDEENSSGRLIGTMFAAFAFVAMLVATAGLYGVLSYLVSQRIPEIAVRMALGASRSEIARDVIGRSLRLAVLGVVLGLGGGLGLAQAISASLYGVAATDPATYGGAGLLALTAALMAAWVPTRRALRVDPIESLRQA